MAWSQVSESIQGEPVSPTLAPLLVDVRVALEADPQPLRSLYDAVDALLVFLSSESGRTHANCVATASSFATSDDFYVYLDSLPAPLLLVLDDIGTCLGDAVAHPETALNFDSTPERLLSRLHEVNIDHLVT